MTSSLRFLDSRFFSGLIIVAIVGSLVYLGATDFILWRVVAYGHSTVYLDYVSPFEALIILPFCGVMLFLSGLRELKRLVA